MQNLVPIQITLQAANADNVQQLVMDLAGKFSGTSQLQTAGVESPNLGSAIPAQQYTPPSNPAVPAQPAYPQQPQQPQQPQPPAGVVPTAPLAQQYTPPAQQPPAGAVPTSAPQYDLTQLGVAAQPLVDAGQSAQILGWLNQHGAQALTELNPGLYGEFATFLRSLGAKI